MPCRVTHASSAEHLEAFRILEEGLAGADQIDAAAKAGGVSFLASGCNPGGIAERFPLTFSGWCNRIDRITMTECGDCRDYASEGVIRDLMNLGRTPDEAMNNPVKEMLTSFWNEPIDMIAEGLGSEVIDYEARHDFILANQPITNTHVALSPENRAKAGVSESLVRLSVGIENTAVLIEDLEQALKKV